MRDPGGAGRDIQSCIGVPHHHGRYDDDTVDAELPRSRSVSWGQEIATMTAAARCKGSVLVTGSAGLVGSAVVKQFAQYGWRVVGCDSFARSQFFGAAADTRACHDSWRSQYPAYQFECLDIRDSHRLSELVRCVHPDLVVHAAAQPSHDYSAGHPELDFAVNATATLSLLQAVQLHCSESTFVFLSTNKVYGTAPNELPVVELDTRYDFAFPAHRCGLGEDTRIDQSLHSPFGVSKLAADLMVQEYGRYYGLRTLCLRPGCIAGPGQMGVPLHGFLGHLIRCAITGSTYTVYGYNGKQVRDILHVSDLVAAIELFWDKATQPAVYNIGGGRDNSVSIHEAAALVYELCGMRLNLEVSDSSRLGDHICYYTDTSRLQRELPWKPRVSLRSTVAEVIEWCRLSRIT